MTADSRQPDLIMLAAWLGISLDTAEIVRTLLWAAVVEIVEMAAFGFAGFFWLPRGERSATTKAEPQQPSAISNPDEVPPRSQEAAQPWKGDREAWRSGRAVPPRHRP